MQKRPTLTLPKADPAPPPPRPAPPTSARLLAPFGFVNEYDAVYFKPEGALITNPIEIAILRERGAQLVDA